LAVWTIKPPAAADSRCTFIISAVLRIGE